ncbi:hypothetical protein KC957_04515, partial [Candidatus Saccharibacteria bacterium]|nr:hypothetical protein [Candidatus Saccharibacteria bacterium]
PRADGSGGTIYTCTNGSGKYDGPGLMSYCRNTLTVYGSFIAKDVKFLRLAGSISTANAGDAYTASSAAEKFVYGPEAWLKTTNLSPQVGTYDSITSMPPVF